MEERVLDGVLIGSIFALGRIDFPSITEFFVQTVELVVGSIGQLVSVIVLVWKNDPDDTVLGVIVVSFVGAATTEARLVGVQGECFVKGGLQVNL